MKGVRKFCGDWQQIRDKYVRNRDVEEVAIYAKYLVHCAKQVVEATGWKREDMPADLHKLVVGCLQVGCKSWALAAEVSGCKGQDRRFRRHGLAFLALVGRNGKWRPPKRRREEVDTSASSGWKRRRHGEHHEARRRREEDGGMDVEEAIV